MGNKLKDLFTEEPDELTGIIHFANRDSYQKFVDKMDEVYVDGKPARVDGIKSIQFNMNDGDNQYQIEEQKHIKQVIVYPYQEEINIPIEFRGKQEQFVFHRKILQDKIELVTPVGAIVEVLIVLDTKKENVRLTYTTYDERAKDIQELIYAYERMFALIDSLYAKDFNNDEKNRMQLYFKESISYFQRLEELSMSLGICIEPALIKSEKDSQGMIERLYLLCVKKRKIRSNDRLNSISEVSVMECEVGQEILTTHIYKEDYDLFNKKVTIYTVSCMFNAIVSKIEKDKEGTMKIYFTDSDIKPMYRSYSAHMTLQEAEKEREGLFDCIDQYRDAKKFLEQFEEILENK
ncbi:MAG: hypothetical protein IJO65_05100 [Lachnospiraceae bacterium]|nr:hypothetical protein [Lachnospiraceae bacterium]